MTSDHLTFFRLLTHLMLCLILRGEDESAQASRRHRCYHATWHQQHLDDQSCDQMFSLQDHLVTLVLSKLVS